MEKNSLLFMISKHLAFIIGILMMPITGIGSQQQIQTILFGEQGTTSALVQEAYGAGALTNVFALPTDNIFYTKSYYTIAFSTATTGSIRTVDMTFPAGFNVSSAKLIEAQGIGSGSLSVSGQVVKYTVISPVSVVAPKSIKIMVAGITNAATVSNQVTISTIEYNILDGPTNSAPFTLTPVKNAMIDNLAVTSSKIAPNSVDSTKIKDGEIRQNDLSINSVDGNKIADSSIGFSDIGPDSVNTNKIIDGSIFATDLADNTLTERVIANNAIGGSKIAPNTIDSSKILDGSITKNDVSSAFIKKVVLKDDPSGAAVGWKPDGSEREFYIRDSQITRDSVVQFTIGHSGTHVSTDCILEGTVPGIIIINCLAIINYDDPLHREIYNGPEDGAQLNYIIIN